MNINELAYSITSTLLAYRTTPGSITIYASTIETERAFALGTINAYWPDLIGFQSIRDAMRKGSWSFVQDGGNARFTRAPQA